MIERSKFTFERRPREIGLLGGGVIGGGWAAWFVLLNRVDVRLYGQSTSTVERVQEKLGKAERAYRRLMLAPLLSEGALTVVESVADSVRGMEPVQEPAPERLEFKQQLLAAASRAAAPERLICSSISELLPSLLQAKTGHPERLLVAHPSHLVHLRPLVELCASQSTALEILLRVEIFESAEIHPLVVRKEVDRFTANRLQERVWRAALWLMHYDVDTIQEADNEVWHSFRLRAPPILQPSQPHRTCQGARRAMERFGSSCVAGETLASLEQELRDRAPQLPIGSGPLRMPTRQISSNWIAKNGRLTESRNHQLSPMGHRHSASFRRRKQRVPLKVRQLPTVETHRELRASDRRYGKYLHLFDVLTPEGHERSVAAGEQVLLRVNSGSGRMFNPRSGVLRVCVRSVARCADSGFELRRRGNHVKLWIVRDRDGFGVGAWSGYRGPLGQRRGAPRGKLFQQPKGCRGHS